MGANNTNNNININININMGTVCGLNTERVLVRVYPWGLFSIRCLFESM
jgi:hypothetical protein